MLSDGSDESRRAAFFLVGTFMAAWVILYGAVQAAAPRLLRAEARGRDDLAASAAFWVATLFLVPAALAAAAWVAGGSAPWLTASVVVGLLVFGVLFAINSSLHSYLILAFTDPGRVTMDVGFYYMANAAGHLIGTVLSGLSYQLGGLKREVAPGLEHRPRAPASSTGLEHRARKGLDTLGPEQPPAVAIPRDGDAGPSLTGRAAALRPEALGRAQPPRPLRSPPSFRPSCSPPSSRGPRRPAPSRRPRRTNLAPPAAQHPHAGKLTAPHEGG